MEHSIRSFHPSRLKKRKELRIDSVIEAQNICSSHTLYAHRAKPVAANTDTLLFPSEYIVELHRSNFINQHIVSLNRNWFVVLREDESKDVPIKADAESSTAGFRPAPAGVETLQQISPPSQSIGVQKHKFSLRSFLSN
jgi:hypothetical protein